MCQCAGRCIPAFLEGCCPSSVVQDACAQRNDRLMLPAWSKGFGGKFRCLMAAWLVACQLLPPRPVRRRFRSASPRGWSTSSPVGAAPSCLPAPPRWVPKPHPRVHAHVAYSLEDALITFHHPAETLPNNSKFCGNEEFLSPKFKIMAAVLMNANGSLLSSSLLGGAGRIWLADLMVSWVNARQVVDFPRKSVIFLPDKL